MTKPKKIKLIVEVDEELYNAVKGSDCEFEKSLTAIAHGTPYDPKGDLISREALKEDFKSRLADCNEWIEKAKDKETKIRASAVKSYIAEVIMTIDNAPTVEPDLEFAKWVTNMIFDNQVKDFDFEMFSELACRKLEKMGLVEKTESEWIKKGGAE